jgi:peroxiredoxin
MDRAVSMAYGAADSDDAKYPARISYLVGPDGRIKKVYGKVKPADHPDEVLRDLA